MMNTRKQTTATSESATKRQTDYLSLIRNATSFNSRLVLDRTNRSPFIDTQTGVAQSSCALWRSERDRVRCQPDSEEALPARGREGLLYCYPRVFRRRHSLDRTAASSEREAPVSSSASTSSSSSSFGWCRSNQDSEQVSKLARQQHQFQSQQPAPRADSTGSHSFADSDSRDHSSATSQSLESPRSQQLDDEHRNDNDEREDPSRAIDDVDKSLDVVEARERAKRVRLAKVKQNPNDRRRSLGLGAFKRSKSSLLAASAGDHDGTQTQTNGRKTTQDNNNEQIKTGVKRGANQKSTAHAKKARTAHREPQAQQNLDGSRGPLDPSAKFLRPYVCPICDQTYKTRPGLSYHFIHAHDTILPRSLPVKIAGKVTSSQAKVDGTNAGDSQSSVRKRSKKGHLDKNGLKRTERVLRHSTRLLAATLKEDCPTGHAAEATSSSPPIAVETADNHSNCETLTETEAEQKIDSVKTEPAGAQTSIASNTQEVLQEKMEPATLHDDHGQPPPGLPADCSEGQNPTDANTEPQLTNEIDLAAKTFDSKDDCEQADIIGLSEESREPIKPSGKQNLFCDFCLGTADKNRRTRLPEELISCSTCGSSGHPSCLRFSENIRRSVKNYAWQCIECKTCSTCHKADHEDQLLFCDDCDRSYHTYCLSPRLDHPPEGNWTCKPCLNEYYTA